METSWYQISIARSDFTQMAARVFMVKMSDRFAKDGWERHPPGATIYQVVTAQGDHVYYVSPEMASISTDVLDKFGGAPCALTPDLSSARQVPL